MHEHVGKHAKIKRDKESQMGAQSKHNITRNDERVCIKQTDITEMCSHKQLHPNKTQEGRTQTHKQVALKTNKHKPTEGTKHGKT